MIQTVRIRERNNEFQLYEKLTEKIVFKGKTQRECSAFLASHNDEFSFEATPENGVQYIY